MTAWNFRCYFYSSAVVSAYSYKYSKQILKFHGRIKLLTFEPRSLKIISTSKILPNCCKETEKLHENKVTSTLLPYTVQTFISENGAQDQ